MLLFSILSFDYIKKFGQLYIIVLLVMTMTTFYVRMKNAQSDAIEYKSELSVCSNHLEVQNAAIVEWKREGEQAKQRYQEAVKAAEVHRIESAKSLQALIAANVPTQCEDAIKWGIEQQVGSFEK